MEETAESAGDSAEELEGFSQRFKGAMTAAVAALAIGAAGLLSQVPVLGEAFAGLGAVVDAVALKMDSVLRPAVSDITDTLFEVANSINESEGGFGKIIGILGTVASGAGLVVGALAALGVTLSGPILAAIGIVAGAIAALWIAWETNFANIQGVAESVLSRISTRFNSFVTKVKPLVMGFLNSLEQFWNNHGDAIKSVVNFAFRVIGATIVSTIDLILTTIQAALQLLSGDWKGAWETITGFLGRMAALWGPLILEAVNTIVDVFVDLATRLASWANSVAQDAFDWGVSLIQSLLDGILSLAESVVRAIEDVINGMIDVIDSAIEKLPDEVRSRLGVEQIGNISVGTSFGGRDAAEDVGQAPAIARRGRRAASGDFSSNLQLDGRQLTESTGRYRSDPGRRRGL
jgi:phage-related protein